ncbi:MAG: hypothetical protein R3234_02310, partial [Thermoanaerobaculia bacterium]|nr:hypothetical protein [Thermoanaerobaculia bacterium]
MPETPFTGLIRSLRKASNPWERLRLIAGGARTLGALPQRQRRALVRNLGLAGAEDLVDRLAGDDEEVVATFRGALDRIEEDPEAVERLVARLRDPKTRKETLLGLFGHLEEAVHEEVDEVEGEEEERGGEGQRVGSSEIPERERAKRPEEPRETEAQAEVEGDAKGESESRGRPPTTDRRRASEPPIALQSPTEEIAESPPPEHRAPVPRATPSPRSPRAPSIGPSGESLLEDARAREATGEI